MFHTLYNPISLSYSDVEYITSLASLVSDKHVKDAVYFSIFQLLLIRIQLDSTSLHLTNDSVTLNLLNEFLMGSEAMYSWLMEKRQIPLMRPIFSTNMKFSSSETRKNNKTITLYRETHIPCNYRLPFTYVRALSSSPATILDSCDGSDYANTDRDSLSILSVDSISDNSVNHPLNSNPNKRNKHSTSPSGTSSTTTGSVITDDLYGFYKESTNVDTETNCTIGIDTIFSTLADTCVNSLSVIWGGISSTFFYPATNDEVPQQVDENDVIFATCSSCYQSGDEDHNPMLNDTLLCLHSSTT
jgi:hypothetical protein